MSFILDALKKSEAERQRQSVPGLMDMGPSTARRRFPVWGIWLGALLGINLIVLLLVLTRAGSGTAPNPAVPAEAAAPAAAVAAAPASPKARADTHPFSPLDPIASPVYAPEIPVGQTLEPPVGAISPDEARAAERPIGPAQSFGPQLRVAPPPPEKGEVLPTLSEINLSGNRGIPELHLDIHVYAAKPAERFVFINSQKYREGGTLAEGPTIERITRDGVVLSYQTLRFFLPRQ
jgi:general secretion pathway protein B